MDNNSLCAVQKIIFLITFFLSFFPEQVIREEMSLLEGTRIK